MSIQPSFSRLEPHPKGWGDELWITNNEKYCGKILRFKKGSAFSMHYHIRKPSPDFHREIINELLKLDRGDKMAVVAPRGHAKSTLINLVYPLHRILFDEEKFILLISESERQ